jgi:type I restriction enzyme S subunit
MLGFDACFPDSVVGFTPNDRVRVEFIQFWLRTLQGQLEEEAPQAAQRNINLQTLRELELFIPPIGKQNEFVDHIAKIRELRNSQTMAHLRLDELFRCALRLSLRGDL